MALTPKAWKEARETIQNLLSVQNSTLQTPEFRAKYVFQFSNKIKSSR